MRQAIIGHNNPPSEIEILQERLHAYGYEDEVSDLEKREIPFEIKTDEEASKLSDFIAAVKIKASDVSDAHKKEKQPFWDAGKAADNWKNKLTARLDSVVNVASAPLLAWNKKKAEAERQRQLEIARKAQEEADRLAAEAAEHAKAGIEDTAEELQAAAIQADQKADMIIHSSMNVKAKTGGAFSSSSIKKTWVGKIESLAALDLEALRPYFAEEDLQKALSRAVRDGKRDIRGAIIFEEETLSNRRR